MSERSIVLLTGATGFTGAHVLNALLEHDYYVIATVRNLGPARAWFGQMISNYPDRLAFVQTSDLSSPGALDPVLKLNPAIQYLIHLASPSPPPYPGATKADEELFAPAADMNTNVINSVIAHGASIRSVVIGSCFHSMTNDPPRFQDPSKVYTVRDINPISRDRARLDPVSARIGARTFAEDAAWRAFDAYCDFNFSLSTVVLPLVLGPPVHPLPANINQGVYPKAPTDHTNNEHSTECECSGKPPTSSSPGTGTGTITSPPSGTANGTSTTGTNTSSTNGPSPGPSPSPSSNCTNTNSTNATSNCPSSNPVATTAISTTSSSNSNSPPAASTPWFENGIDFIRYLLDNTDPNCTLPPLSMPFYVDVRMAAMAFLRVIEPSNCMTSRWFIASDTINSQQIVDIARTYLSPDRAAALPQGMPGTGDDEALRQCRFDPSDTEELLGVQDRIDMETTVRDTLEKLLELSA